MKKFLIIAVLLTAIFLTSCGSYSGDSIDAASLGAALYEQEETYLIDNLDFYSSYFTANEFSMFLEDYNGSYAGIGVYMAKDPQDKYITFLAIMPDLPAYKAGVEAGDRLLSIDGEDMAEIDSDIVATKLRGQAGTAVKIEVLRPATEEKLTFKLIREVVESSSVRGQLIEGQAGIAYIYIIEFTEKTPDEFSEIYDELQSQQQIKGLIIDLRNDGGGSVPAALKIAGYFIPKGQILMYERMKTGYAEAYSKGDGHIKVPVICLQNGNTASASEIFIGSLRDYSVAQTVGEQSYGKGITQLIYQLNDGTALRFTKSRYLTPNKYDLHGVGLAPDYQVPMEGENLMQRILAVDASNDPQLAKAISLLKEK